MVFKMSFPSASEGLCTYQSTAKWEFGLVCDFTEQFNWMGLFSTKARALLDLLTCSLVTGKERSKNRIRRDTALQEVWASLHLTLQCWVPQGVTGWFLWLACCANIMELATTATSLYWSAPCLATSLVTPWILPCHCHHTTWGCGGILLKSSPS